MFTVIVKEAAFCNGTFTPIPEKYYNSTLTYGPFSTIEEADEFVDKTIKIKIKRHKRELDVYKIKPIKPVVRKGLCKGKKCSPAPSNV